MSMSGTFLSKKETYIKEPLFDPIDMDRLLAHFLTHASKTSSRTTDIEKIAIKKACLSKNLIQLMELINEFLADQKRYGTPNGLSPSKREEFVAHVRALRKMKEVPMEQRAEAFISHFISTKRKLKPIEDTIAWWEKNFDYLRTEKAWNKDFPEYISRAAAKDRKSSSAAKLLQQKLVRLRDEWLEHHTFAHYNSHDLHEFYQSYISLSALHEKIEAVRSDTNSFVVKNYLRDFQEHLKRLERQAIHSMLERLITAEHYADIEYDDLVMSLCDQLDKNCNIKPHGKSNIPSARRSLTPELFIAFTNIIESYCATHPNEVTLIKRFKQLMIRQAEYYDANNPVISYAKYAFPILIEVAQSETSLAALVLNVGCEYDDSSILHKLKKMVGAVNTAYAQLKRDNQAGAEITRYVNHTNKTYQDTLKNISQDIQKRLEQQYNDVFNDILHDNKLDEAKVSLLVENIENAKIFATQHLDDHYFVAADIMLALAKRTQQHIAAERELTQRHTQLFYVLLQKVYSNLDAEHLAMLNNNLKQLPAQVNGIREKNEDVLHFIASRMETAMMAVRGLETSLRRHRHIAGAKWVPLPSSVNNDSPTDAKAYMMLAYVENVTLPSISYSPASSIEKLDDQSITASIDEFNNFIAHSNFTPEETNSFQRKAEALRHQIEAQVLKKCNDVFHLKNHLFKKDDNRIDLEKLSALVSKKDRLFKKAEHHKAFTKTIQDACISLTQNLLVHCIKTRKAPDAEYLTKLNAILKMDVTAALALKKNNEFKVTLKAVLDTFDGTSTYIANILLLLSPDDQLDDYSDLMIAYAEKRLSIIALTNEVSEQDYEFFHHAKALPEIKGLLRDKQREMQGNINKSLTKHNLPWSRREASVIELFGSDEQVFSYRKKRALELFKLDNTQLPGECDEKKIIAEFKSSINMHRTSAGSLIDAKSAATSKLTMEQFIDNIVEVRNITPFLSGLLPLCGTPLQLQRLRTNTVLRHLEKSNEATSDWLRNEAILQENQSEPTDMKARQAHKQAMCDFFGIHHIPDILNRIEESLRELGRLDKDKAEIANTNLHHIERLIASITPLRPLYNAFSGNKQNIAFFGRIEDFKRKAKLRHGIYHTLKQHRFLSTATPSVNLNDDIPSFIQAIVNLQKEQSGLLNKYGILDYLVFCETHIFSKIEEILSNDEGALDAESITMIAVLLDHFATDRLKSLLCDAAEDEVALNPYWLSIINHPGQRSTLVKLNALSKAECAVKNAKFDPKKPTVTNPDFDPSLPMSADNNPFINSPIESIDPAATVKNPYYDPHKPTTRNPAYDPKKVINNHNHPFVNSQILFIHWSHAFKQTLSFVTRLHNAKKHVQHMLKTDMAKDADIPVDIDLHDSFSLLPQPISGEFHNEKLLNFWEACARRLKYAVSILDALFPFINSLVALFMTISNEILKRSTNNSVLLKNFMRRFGVISEIFIKMRTTFVEPEPHPTKPKSMWEKPTQINLLIRPITLMTEKAYAIHMRHLIEKFIEEKLGEKYLPNFIAYCQANAENLKTPGDIDQIEITTLLQPLGLTPRQKTRAYKVAYVMQLYCKLTAIYEGKANMNGFAEFLNQTQQHIEQNPLLKNLKQKPTLANLLKQLHTANMEMVKTVEARVPTEPVPAKSFATRLLNKVRDRSESNH